MNVALYCSYQYSVLGYRESFADMEKRTLTARETCGRYPRMISMLFNHGGATLVAGYDSEKKTYYLLLKNMDTKDKDDQERKVYINIAFLSEDPQEMHDFTKGFLAQYSAVSQAFHKLLTLDVIDEIGYGVDFDVLSKVIESCEQFGRQPDAKSLWDIRYEPAKPFDFVVLEIDWNYFAQSNRLQIRGDSVKSVSNGGKCFSEHLVQTREKLWPDDEVIVSPKQQPDGTDKRFVALEAVVGAIKTDVNGLERKLADVERLVSNGVTKNELNGIDRKLADLESQINNNRPVVLPAGSADAKASAALAALSGDVQALQIAVKPLQSGMQSVQNDMETVHNHVGILQSDMKSVQGDLTKIQNNNGKETAELARLCEKTEKESKMLRIAVIVAVLIAMISMIISFSAISKSKKGASDLWQTSSTASTYQSSDTRQTSQP